MIKFTIGGKEVDANNITDSLMKAVLESISRQLREKIGSIRDPETGEFPTIVVRGDSLENLTVHAEGSPQLVALVKERLGIPNEANGDRVAESEPPPKVFLSYTSDDQELAARIANALQQNGIETWWDKWCISPGESLRQKIDEGLSGCTHFLVLLTPQSLAKPWVNAEMDAALVRKLNNLCKFFPVRYQLPALSLPPLLAGLRSPEIASNEDVAQLILDIYGVTRRPTLGPPPAIVSHGAASHTGYSVAANAVAKHFVEHSRNGMFADPQISVETLAAEIGLSVDDTEDALHELSPFLKISLHHVLVQGSLFAEFDGYWQKWNPADDALRLAADIVNDPKFTSSPGEIAALYGWTPRQLNSAIHYLLERGLIRDYSALGSAPYTLIRVVGNADTRRFVKSRSN